MLLELNAAFLTFRNSINVEFKNYGLFTIQHLVEEQWLSAPLNVLCVAMEMCLKWTPGWPLLNFLTKGLMREFGQETGDNIPAVH